MCYDFCCLPRPYKNQPIKMMTDIMIPTMLVRMMGRFWIEKPYNIQISPPVIVMRYVIGDISPALLLVNIFIACGSDAKARKIPEIVARV